MMDADYRYLYECLSTDLFNKCNFSGFTPALSDRQNTGPRPLSYTLLLQHSIPTGAVQWNSYTKVIPAHLQPYLRDSSY
jgi:hypothetical protein